MATAVNHFTLIKASADWHDSGNLVTSRGPATGPGPEVAQMTEARRRLGKRMGIPLYDHHFTDGQWEHDEKASSLDLALLESRALATQRICATTTQRTLPPPLNSSEACSSSTMATDPCKKYKPGWTITRLSRRKQSRYTLTR